MCGCHWGMLMRRLSLACIAAVAAIAFTQVALAADLPVKAPRYAPPPPAPVYSWTGFYIGGFVGGAWQSGNVTTTDPCFAGTVCPTIGTYNAVLPVVYKLDASFIGGGTIGYNYQFASSPLVIGAELEGGYIHLHGSAIMNPFPGASDTSANTTIGDWYIAYTGRLGIAYNNWLFYGKAGGVTAEVKTGVVDTSPPVTVDTSVTKTVSGWAAGGGIEYALSQNWTIKGEYLFLGLRDDINHCGLSISPNSQGTLCSQTSLNGVHTAKLGFNYKFAP